jgi:PAS domain S-box-containing protein
MRAVIIGGGKGCKAIIKLALTSFLKELPLDILSVADPDPNAKGMVFARKKGIKTTSDMKKALSLPDINLVIELTGKDDVLENIYKIIPRGIKVFDHTFAKIFVDLANAQKDQARQLREITGLEQKFTKERYFLQSMFDNMPELVAVFDKDKNITRINASFSQFSGLSPEKAVGRSCTELFVGTELSENSGQTRRMLDDVLKFNERKILIWQSPSPDKTVWEITHTPILGKSGKSEEILSIWHRITEQALLQHKIDSAEQRFRSFMDSAHDWISIKDLDGRYVIVNKICAQSLNLQPADFIGKKPHEVLPADLAEMIINHDKQVIKDDCYHSFSEIVPIAGRDQHFQTNRFPLKDYKGSTIGVCTIMRNVTSEITLRKQLEQAGKLAAIGKLAAGVAHEINNPLTGVLAYAEDLISDTPTSDPHHNDLEVIIRETLRCRDIVRDLLDFSRQEDPQFERLNPNKIVEQSLSLVRKLPQFRNIEMATDYFESIPSILGDPHQIQQVILNFMLNAVEAMKGKGRIAVKTEYDQDRDECVIVVEDDGPGIPDNIRGKIFEPFFSTKGTSGLGLAVSWGIIERHLGKIDVRTSSSGGASFNIIFPPFDQNTNSNEEGG